MKKQRHLLPEKCKNRPEQLNPGLVSQSFVLSANKTAFVSPQVLEGHNLTPGLSRINLFYFFSNVLLHSVFHRNVLAIGGSIVARYGFAKALGGVGATVARKLKEHAHDETKRKEHAGRVGCIHKLLILPAMNQQGVKKHGVPSLHVQVSAKGR